MLRADSPFSFCGLNEHFTAKIPLLDQFVQVLPMTFAHAIRNEPAVGYTPPTTSSTKLAQDLFHRHPAGRCRLQIGLVTAPSPSLRGLDQPGSNRIQMEVPDEGKEIGVPITQD